MTILQSYNSFFENILGEIHDRFPEEESEIKGAIVSLRDNLDKILIPILNADEFDEIDSLVLTSILENVNEDQPSWFMLLNLTSAIFLTNFDPKRYTWVNEYLLHIFEVVAKSSCEAFEGFFEYERAVEIAKDDFGFHFQRLVTDVYYLVRRFSTDKLYNKWSSLLRKIIEIDLIKFKFKDILLEFIDSFNVDNVNDYFDTLVFLFKNNSFFEAFCTDPDIYFSLDAKVHEYIYIAGEKEDFVKIFSKLFLLSSVECTKGHALFGPDIVTKIFSKGFVNLLQKHRPDNYLIHCILLHILVSFHRQFPNAQDPRMYIIEAKERESLFQNNGEFKEFVRELIDVTAGDQSLICYVLENMTRYESEFFRKLTPVLALVVSYIPNFDDLSYDVEARIFVAIMKILEFLSNKFSPNIGDDLNKFQEVLDGLIYDGTTLFFFFTTLGKILHKRECCLYFDGNVKQSLGTDPIFIIARSFVFVSSSSSTGTDSVLQIFIKHSYISLILHLNEFPGYNITEIQKLSTSYKKLFFREYISLLKFFLNDTQDSGLIDQMIGFINVPSIDTTLLEHEISISRTITEQLHSCYQSTNISPRHKESIASAMIRFTVHQPSRLYFYEYFCLNDSSSGYEAISNFFKEYRIDTEYFRENIASDTKECIFQKFLAYDPPDEYMDEITCSIMSDPILVIDKNGNQRHYESSYFIPRKEQSSDGRMVELEPMTQAEIVETRKDAALKSKIEKYIEEQRKKFDDVYKQITDDGIKEDANKLIKFFENKGFKFL